MLYNDEAIRRMFKVEYMTYERMYALPRLVIAVVLLLAALFVVLPVYAKVICLLMGCWLITSSDFPSRIQAERVLEVRGGETSTVACRFDNSGVRVENGLRFPYAQVDRLLEDDRYFYVFKDRQSAVMLSRSGLTPDEPEQFKQFIAQKTGKVWKRAHKSVVVALIADLEQTVQGKISRITGR